jgi:Phosphotransferase enzyme family
VRLPPLTGAPDSALVNAVAGASPEWQAGPVEVRGATRIGAGYGLGDGPVYRVEADAAHGRLSFVLKHEAAQAVERALQFQRAVGPLATGAIPALLGGAVDQEDDTGILLLEDVAPAAQGDALLGCTDAEAAAAVRSLAQVHAVSWSLPGTAAGGDVPRWSGTALGGNDWTERLAAAAERYPGIVTATLAGWLAALPDRVEGAIAALESGPTAWIHGDAHLDNVLFRPDGAAVLLDWSGAAVGPPAIDLARLLTEGVNAGAREELGPELVAAYADTLAAGGVHVAPDDLWRALADGLALLVQTAVGWAAREPRDVPRMGALQENLLRSALAWASNPRTELV